MDFFNLRKEDQGILSDCIYDEQEYTDFKDLLATLRSGIIRCYEGSERVKEISLDHVLYEGDLEFKIDPNYIKGNASSLIRSNRLFEHKRIFQVLIKCGFNINSMIMRNIEADDIDNIRMLIELGADMNHECMISGNSALNLSRSYEMTKLLLENGADVNHINVCGISILHKFCAHSDPRMVQLLLDHGADPNIISDRNQLSPLLTLMKMVSWDVEVGKKRKQQEVFHVLLDNGAELYPELKRMKTTK